MASTAKAEFKYPEAYCALCATRTPHLHERRAVAGRMVVRSVCQTCNTERPQDVGDK